MKKIVIPGRLAGILTAEANLLRRAEVTVFTSSSNAEALALHQAEKVDLIAADLVDPLLTGETFCLRVRAEDSLRQVAILLLCRDTELERRRAGSCHANGILYLPVQPDALIESVAQLLAVAERRCYRVLVQVRTEVARRRETFHCISRNISVSGILLETDKLLAAGERISCAFFLPDGRQVCTEGEIVRAAVQSNGRRHYGVRYAGLDEDTQRTLEEFVRLSTSPGR